MTHAIRVLLTRARSHHIAGRFDLRDSAFNEAAALGWTGSRAKVVSRHLSAMIRTRNPGFAFTDARVVDKVQERK